MTTQLRRPLAVAALLLLPFLCHAADEYATTSISDATCQKGELPALDGFIEIDIERYLDLPDPISSRVSMPLEEELLTKLLQTQERPQLTKVYCQLGVVQLIIDFAWAVEDDSIAFESMRAIYQWQTSEDVDGWQLSELGSKSHCARGRAADTKLCL